MLEINKVYNEDCIGERGMALLDDGSVDMVLCDLPYGTTACKWDTVIDFEKLWKQYERIIKPNGAIVLTAGQPFTSALIMSNPKLFKYEWIWHKSIAGNFVNAKNAPLKKHENVLVFSKGTIANKSNRRMEYYPQGLIKSDLKWKRPKLYESDGHDGGYLRKSRKTERIIEYTNYPISILEFPQGNNKTVHPTQKPVALMEYLINTYTNPGDLILDNCLGSGTTAVAAVNTGRNFIGFELDKGYYDIAVNRVAEAIKNVG